MITMFPLSLISSLIDGTSLHHQDDLHDGFDHEHDDDHHEVEEEEEAEEAAPSPGRKKRRDGGKKANTLRKAPQAPKRFVSTIYCVDIILLLAQSQSWVVVVPSLDPHKLNTLCFYLFIHSSVRAEIKLHLLLHGKAKRDQGSPRRGRECCKRLKTLG